MGFSDEDTIGTFQPYDDVLVVTLRIGGYDVKRVLVDQGSGVEIMYPDLYKGLNLKLKDLSKYDSPLVGFDGRVVVYRGMIKLLVQARNEVVKVEFIVVETYFLYMAILVINSICLNTQNISTYQLEVSSSMIKTNHLS